MTQFVRDVKKGERCYPGETCNNLCSQSVSGMGQLRRPSLILRLFVEKRTLHGGLYLLEYTERLLPLTLVSDFT